MDLPIQKYGQTERRKFGSINEVIDIPDLVEIHKDRYNAFIDEGISEVFQDFSPITDYSDRFELFFLKNSPSGATLGHYNRNYTLSYYKPPFTRCQAFLKSFGKNFKLSTKYPQTLTKKRNIFYAY